LFPTFFSHEDNSFQKKNQICQAESRNAFLAEASTPELIKQAVAVWEAQGIGGQMWWDWV